MNAVATAIRDHATMANSHLLSKREEVWLRSYCACAASSNVTEDKVPISWADACLKTFDLRFPASAPAGKPAPSPEPAP